MVINPSPPPKRADVRLAAPFRTHCGLQRIPPPAATICPHSVQSYGATLYTDIPPQSWAQYSIIILQNPTVASATFGGIPEERVCGEQMAKGSIGGDTTGGALFCNENPPEPEDRRIISDQDAASLRVRTFAFVHPRKGSL